ncbi:YoaK family protein [Nocardia jiangxiensis]|uniref:YoaK family protein n=1 Tax=Nocardia jiangxiensis TaxID=282685 RepID=A0ABW6S894_9NOCA
MISGMVDAISYLGLGHVFTANMTGNVVILGFAAARTPGFSVAGSLLSLAAFLVGSVLAGRTAIWFRERPRTGWLRTTLAAEAVLQAIGPTAAPSVQRSTTHLACR